MIHAAEPGFVKCAWASLDKWPSPSRERSRALTSSLGPSSG
jgi:hypothetical protein